MRTIADGTIRIRIDVDGKDLELTNKDLDNVEKGSRKAGDGIKKFATSLGLVAIGAMAFKTLKGAMDDAITRFDTLNKFPKVLEALGVSAEDSKRAMTNLADGIDGLPTKLNDIAQTAQRMYTSFGDMDKATDSALALNNALLGSGASADQAKRGTEMYLKALQTGTIDMNTWNTLSETMDVGLVKVAESMGYTGKTAKGDLYNALKTGEKSLDDFNDALIEVGTGSGIMAKLARENTMGLATSWENLKTAAVRGMVEIIDSFNRLSKSVTGRELARNIDSLKGAVFSSFQTIAKTIDATTPVVVFFADGVKATIPIVKALSPAIIGLMTAYGGYVVITRASAAIQVAQAALKTATTTTVGASTAMASLTVVQQASTKAVQADMLMRALQNREITLGTLAIGLLTGKVTLATVAKIAMTVATNALGAAIRFMMGPVGWIITGIGLLTTGVIALVKWFNRTTEAGEELTKETEEISEATNNLLDSVDESEKAYRDQRREIDVNTEKNKQLAGAVVDLTNKEKLSAAEKRTLISNINELNESVDGLKLSYNEEANALNMSSEELQKRIQLMHDLESGMGAQERFNELTREQIELEMQFEETTKKRREWDQALKDGTVTGAEYKEEVEALAEEERNLKDSLAEVSEQHAETEEQVEQSMKAMREAISQGIADQIISYEKLPPKMQEIVGELKGHFEEYKDSATDMFDTLSDEIDLTIDDLIENMEENQRIMGEWADNIAILAERGIDEGLLEELRKGGPETAGLTKEIVNASDEELERLNEVFGQGGDVAMDTLATSIGVENTEILDALGHLIDDVDTTLRDKIDSAGFEEIGINLTDGLADGVDEGTTNVQNAAENMADATTDATKGAFGVNSPSTVFIGIGGDLTDGLAIGIDRGSGAVVKAIMNMFTNVERASTSSFENITSGYDKAISQIERTLSKLPQVTERNMDSTTFALGNGSRLQFAVMTTLSNNYNKSVNDIDKSLNRLPGITQRAMNAMLQRMRAGTRPQITLMQRHSAELLRPYSKMYGYFNAIGINSMDGLTAGLRSGSSRAIAQARSVANSIRSTMQQALRIQSPSKVMRDDVGKWIPAGIAKGIEENARMVYAEIQRLSSGMMRVSRPEMALDTRQMTYTNGGYIAPSKPEVAKPTTESTDNTKQPAIINVFVGSKRVASEIVDDITNMQNRRSNRKRKTGGALA